MSMPPPAPQVAGSTTPQRQHNIYLVRSWFDRYCLLPLFSAARWQVAGGRWQCSRLHCEIRYLSTISTYELHRRRWRSWRRTGGKKLLHVHANSNKVRNVRDSSVHCYYSYVQNSEVISRFWTEVTTGRCVAARNRPRNAPRKKIQIKSRRIVPVLCELYLFLRTIRIQKSWWFQTKRK